MKMTLVTKDGKRYETRNSVTVYRTDANSLIRSAGAFFSENLTEKDVVGGQLFGGFLSTYIILSAEQKNLCQDGMYASRFNLRLVKLLDLEETPGKNMTANELTIIRAIFNNPATVVLWSDGTKTVVKCSENDYFDPEKGLAMAISKKALGNTGAYYKAFKEPVESYYNLMANGPVHAKYRRMILVPDIGKIADDFFALYKKP